jgi:hypothetical protein
LRTFAAFIAQIRDGTVAVAGTGITGTASALSIGGNAATANAGPGGSAFSMRNALFNADFRVNQRGYASAAVLAAGVYGHDRFKAGASGGDYSFTQLNSSTQITIASGKSLIQVVEDKNVVGGSYVLSWTGTALARVGINSATPSGTFVVSPILVTGQTAGTTMSVEFNAGTLGTAQLEQGSVATPFERRPIGLELALCQRYFWKGVPATDLNFNAYTACYMSWPIAFPVTMRATPTPLSSLGGIIYETNSQNAGWGVLTTSGGRLIVSTSAASANATITFTATDFLAASAEL